MVSILNVLTRTEDVDIGGVKVHVREVGIIELVAIAKKNPVIMPLLETVGYDADTKSVTGDISLMRLMLEVPTAIHDLLKIATDVREQEIPQLPLDVLIKLAGAVWRCTMPEGIGPFVEKVVKALEEAGVSLVKETPGTA